MSLLFRDFLHTLADSRENASVTIEDLSRMVGDSVVDDHKLSRGPFVGALVCLHILRKVGQHVIRKGGVISKNHSFFGVVA